MNRKIQMACEKLVVQEEIDTSDLIGFLNALMLSDNEIENLMMEDVAHPYGRQVLFNHPKLEVMLATWTRGMPCAPHDHGGAKSAIRVLKGASHHRVFKLEEGMLKEAYSELCEADEILLCGPKQIHAMGDGNAEDVLVTLHAYSGSIPNMVVYSDTDTYIVNGACGAWIPEQKNDILCHKSGHFWRRDLNMG